MSKKIYWKDLRQSITGSLGRFLSIFFLMMLGSLTLVGLKVTTPNMQRTAQAYINQHKTMDLAVMSSYGLSDQDVAELKSIKGAQVSFGYVSDETVKDSDQAVRIFSTPQDISTVAVTAGKLPQKADQIALADSMQGSYKIGDKITFSANKSQNTLASQTFTVTGFVTSSEIWGKANLGATTAGYGELTGYAVVPEAAFSSEVYTIARLRYDDLQGVDYSGETYSQRLNKHQTALNDLLADNGSQRLAQIRADGQATINQGYADIAAAENRLASAQSQLTSGEASIASGQSQLADAQSQVTSQEGQLSQAGAQLARSQETLNTTAGQLTDAKSQLAQAKAQLDSTKAQLDAAASQLATAASTLESQKAQLDAAAGQLATAESELASAQSQLQALASSISEKEAAISSSESQLESDKASLSAQGLDPAADSDIQAREADLATQKSELESLRATYTSQSSAYETAASSYATQKAQYDAGLAQYNAALATYNSKQAAYQEGLAQYNTGLATYNQQYAAYQAGLSQYQAGLATFQSANNQYSQGLAQLNQAKATIASKQAEIDAAISQLDASKAEYATQKAAVDQQIASAKANLASAQARLDSLATPVYTSYTRSTLPGGDGYEIYKSSTNSISGVGNIFPVVLYIVAAMVTFTTMTRFVDEERTKAGIFKALGYTNGQIIAKFVIYGLLASLLGTLVGDLLGNYFLASQLSRIVGSTTVIGPSRLYLYPGYLILTVFLALLAAVLPAYLVARRELGEKPAQLLLPKPPVSGSKIFLERLTFLWNRLSFTHKVTARNIFRYKQRMLMTIFGVAGSVALLFAGLGIRSSISGIADTQFSDIIHYQMIVTKNAQADQVAQDKLTQTLDDKKTVSGYQAVSYQTVQEDIPNLSERQTVSVVTATAADLKGYISLTAHSSGKAITLDDQGVVLSEKLAKLYGIKTGDTVKITLNDQEVSAKVAAVAEMYTGHFIFLTPTYYESVTGQAASNNAYLVKVTDSSSRAVQKLSADYLTLDAVSAAVLNTSLINQINTVSNSMTSVMVILVVLATLLGVVILYNLTNINVAERIRELSTIKVLGFHNKEVTLYIYRETIVLSLTGILTGLAGGVLLHQVILNMIGSATMMFDPATTLEVWLIPIFAIVLILSVLGWYVNRQLRQVDMLEALKSVD